MKERSHLPPQAVAPNGRPGQPKVFLVEDHPIVRTGLRQLIETAGLSVCGEAESAELAMGAIPKAAPDLVLVDLTLKGSNGLDLIKQLAVLDVKLPILVVSLHDENVYAERVLRAGARGYISKHEAPSTLIKAMLAILDGRLYLSDNVRASLLERAVGLRAPGTTLEARLSDRELQVFTLLGQGYIGPEIAAQMHLSVKTIDSYREALKAKLGAKSGPELLRKAISWCRTEKLA